MKFFRILLLIGFFIGSGCEWSNCSESSDQVEMARGLTEDELVHLFHDASFMIEEANGLAHWEVSQVPESFRALRPVYVEAHGTVLRVKLKGCFDNHVVMEIHIVDSKHGEIVLYWGEGPGFGREVLWHKS